MKDPYIQYLFMHVLSSFFFRQDPYIKLTLHDGHFDEGRNHVGESVKTKTKKNAGGQADFHEAFMLNKPGIRLIL